MKLVSFNIWGGTIYEPLMQYLKQLSADTDIFCFQEVFSSLPGAPEVSSGARMYLFQELQKILPDYTGFFEPRSSGYNFNDSVNFSVNHGLAIFLRKNLTLINYRPEIIEKTKNFEDPVEGWTKAQVLTVSEQGREFSVINFHGVAQPGNKLDTHQRIEHAKSLKLIWENLGGQPKILCGDFNMYPEIESIKILESVSRNLIKDFKIENTRNEVSWKKYPGSMQKFADFTFVSSNIKINSFQVPYNEVSDHLPMLLEFKI